MLAFRPPMKISFIFLILLALASHTHAKTITAYDLHSDLRSALSLVSETELFLDQIEGGRLLPHFRTGHADNLREEARRQAKELRESQVAAGETKLLILCVEQLELLERQLQSIRTAGSDANIAEARKHVECIRKSLMAAGAGQ